MKNTLSATTVADNRVSVKGKFLYLNNEKFYIKGVTYGTFSPKEDGSQFPDPQTVELDFSLMAQNGFNCVRTYTPPPAYLLDIALKHGLKVMVGLPWEQHITFLDSAKGKKDITNRVKEPVLQSKGHPAILCYTIGNEIPATIVRWYGKKKIEGFLHHLYNTVKKADPQSLVTYVNFPTTEYLDLSFLDFDCFNVYLETPKKLYDYIQRLHNLAGDRPLVLAEIGLDSRRNGEERQAEVLKWQIETVFERGSAGMFIFAWTDEWWRGGFDIDDWDFGLVDRQRQPKLALRAVSETLRKVPFATDKRLPMISVVVCSYNGARTIRDTMEGLQNLDYPHFEVIVVNDGSTDNLAAIVKEYPVKLINTPNRGLSNARNTGWQNATGEIVAYIDDDAYPDPQWLRYIAAGFMNSSHAGIGGPNIAPEEDGPIAKCVANAPGGPVHVLLSDEIAEHIPGCNMAFRRKVLMEINGFDPIYRAAGDDVDVCWRVQNAGYTIGFHPSALVWHHRRNSLKAYWKQQKGYGKAEALLEAKWPEKYNGFGHLAWAGRIYGNGFTLPINIKKGKVFYGSWGSALFQSIYQPASGMITALPLMPEWYLFCGLLVVLGLLGLIWSPLLWVWPVFVLSIAVVVIQAFISASRNVSQQTFGVMKPFHTALITFMHIIQPMARLYGRLKHGLTPWRKVNLKYSFKFALVWKAQTYTYWSEEWKAPEDWLTMIENKLKSFKTRVRRGGDFDRWDLQVRNSLFSVGRGLLTIEEHGANKQLIRFKIWPLITKTSAIMISVAAFVSVVATINHVASVAVIFGLIAVLLLAECFKDTSSSLHDLYAAFKVLEAKTKKKQGIQVYSKDPASPAAIRERKHKAEPQAEMEYARLSDK